MMNGQSGSGLLSLRLCRQAVQSCDIFPKDVELKVDDRPDGDIRKVRVRSCIGNDGYLETIGSRFTDGERDPVDSDGTLINSEVSALHHFTVVRVFESEIGASVCIFHVDAFCSLVHVSLYDVAVQPAVHEHRPFDVHAVSYLKQPEVGPFEGFFHGSHRIGVVLDAYDGEADTVMGNTLVDFQFIGE